MNNRGLLMRLDRTNGIPLHVQIRERLRQGITQGAWRVGDTLPSEHDLCARLGVSRGTVRQALSRLAEEGLLIRHRHRGTQVVRGTAGEGLIFVSPYRAMEAAGLRPRITVLAQERRPLPRRVAEAWAAGRTISRPPAEAAIFFDRVFSAGAEPIVRASSWVPAARFGRLLTMDLTAAAFLDILGHEFGVVITRLVERMELTVMTRDHASLLGVPAGSPCLEISLCQWAGEEPVEYAEFWLDPAKSRFLITGLLAVDMLPRTATRRRATHR